MRNLTGVSLALSLAFLAAACGSTKPSSFYLLTPVEVAPALAPVDVRVRLAPVELPQYLGRSEMVLRDGNRIELADYDRWAEPLDRGFSRVLAANLALLVPTQHVLDAPWEGLSEDERVVHVQVDRFDVEDGQAVLSCSWSLSDKMISSGDLRRTHIVKPVEGAGYDAMARALSEALAELSGDIARELRR